MSVRPPPGRLISWRGNGIRLSAAVAGGARLVMTVHVLHAGDGYTYLTRQVASGDTVRARGETLAGYYTATGNPPGEWYGSGTASLGVAGEVSEAQMKALFGQGLHPDADRLLVARAALYEAAGATLARAEAAAQLDVRLGRRFPEFAPKVTGWATLLREGLAAEALRLGLPGVEQLDREERARVAQRVGVATYREAHGREPDSAELTSWVARQTAPARQAVAGYDLVFTPVKSVSVLWALGDPDVAAAVEAAHHAAVSRALDFVETHAALTRTGAGGVAQVDTFGLVVARFDHRDSRTGDPNLHTHAAVSTKVEGRDGKWRSLDGRVLFALGVAASETYTTAVEDELRSRLGVTFADRTGGALTAGRTTSPTPAMPPAQSATASQTTKRDELRPVREIVGIDRALLSLFSSRRTAVDADYQSRVAAYRTRWGHEPSHAAAMRLAQAATLATRGPKGSPRSLALMRADWSAQARVALGVGSDEQVRVSVHRALDGGVATFPAGPVPLAAEPATSGQLAPDQVAPQVDIAEVGLAVLSVVEQHRSTWTVWHLRAEAHRQLRGHPAASYEDRETVVAKVTASARARNVLLTVPPAETVNPLTLTRADGESVFSVHGGALLTSTAILDAESRLVAAARRDTGRAPVPSPVVSAVIERASAGGEPLDAGQRELATVFATSRRRLVAGIGPAGTGKTSAMRALVAAADTAGVRVIGLAPSARAAAVLTDELGVPTHTLHSFLHAAAGEPDLVRAGDVLLVDEAGMAGTLRLDAITTLASRAGAFVRLLGDPAQLAAVESGGALRLIESEVGAVQLDEVHRFHDPAEAAATLQLRGGDRAGLRFYQDAGRIHSGEADGITNSAYAAWRADIAEGRATVLLAGTSGQVADLSARARMDRIADGQVDATLEVALHDGTRAGVGDVVVTRRNDRRLTASRGRDWVRNGDLWQVIEVGSDHSLRVRPLAAHDGRRARRGPVHLPAHYVAVDVELGYAATVHRAQGITVDTAHVLVDEATTRQGLYTALTRGRHANHLYVVTSGAAVSGPDRPPESEKDAEEVLSACLARDGAERPATQVRREERAVAGSLARLVPEYLHAYAQYAEQAYGLRRTVLDVLGPDLGREVFQDGGWPVLAAALARLSAGGDDPRERLGRAAGQRELDSAESVAEVLAWRLQPAAAASINSGLPADVPLPPARGARRPSPGDPVLLAWLDQRAERIRGRLDTLQASAALSPPPWMAAMGARPQGPVGARWDAALRAVLAYRDQAHVDDVHDPLGPRPGTAGQAQRSWDSVRAEIRQQTRLAMVHAASGRRPDRSLAAETTHRRSSLGPVA